MDESQQITHFANDLDALINRYRSEYDLSYASIIGVLFARMHYLCDEARTLGEQSEGAPE
jgi:hypothetical protein